MKPLLSTVLTCLLLIACTPAEFGAAERLSSETRQQRVVWIIDRLEWSDADYLEILEAAEAVERLSAVYLQIRADSLDLQYDPVQFDLLQSAYLAAAREYREAREIIKARWAEFAPEEQLVLQSWDRDARQVGETMNSKLLAINDPSTSSYIRDQLWQDTLSIMPYVITGVKILLPIIGIPL